MGIFYYSTPLFQFSLYEKDIKEFHIKLKNYRYYQNLYCENYKKDIWNDIKKFVNEKFKDIIKESGLDYTDDYKTYIWVHINKDKSIDEIIKSLDEEWFVEKLLNVNMIPRLLTIINKSLDSDNKFMAHSVCEYQAKYGKLKTMITLDIYFDDIKKQCLRFQNYVYNSDSDYSDI